MLQPADVLILDEPTNDLDIPTLEILEEALLEFSGALVLVTHDRYLLDRVTNTVLGLDGHGNAALFADYTQWEQWRLERGEMGRSEMSRSESPAAPSAAPSIAEALQRESAINEARPAPRKKLSYMEQREYDAIETRIEDADARLYAARARVEHPEVVIDPAALTEALVELETAQADHDAIYERWVELTEKIGG